MILPNAQVALVLALAVTNEDDISNTAQVLSRADEYLTWLNRNTNPQEQQ
jgi:hypothetical protein